MGRVFDALRRASSANEGEPAKPAQKESRRRSEVRRERVLPSARQVEEQLLSNSSIMSPVESAVQSSASTAHTADAPDGSALPGGMASRAAGATLGAAGSARAAGFVAYDISAARVEPHLVAVTQPRSPYCEQFRSLRTRILQAGEREQQLLHVLQSCVFSL